jgi:hypothetical protein
MAGNTRKPRVAARQGFFISSLNGSPKEQQRQEELHLIAERFVHDAHRNLACRQPLAFVRDELFLDEGVCILRSVYNHRIRHELAVATFTHAKHRNIILSFHDSKLALRHA